MTSIVNKISTSILEKVGQKVWGFKPNLMRDIVDQHGGIYFLKWFVNNMREYEHILKEIGPIRTHFLAVEISSINGCPYSVYGHAYALQLHYFKKHDQLLEVDEMAMQAFCSLDRATTIQAFRKILSAEEFETERNDFENMLHLFDKKKPPQTEKDNYTLHLIKMFRFLNVCGINRRTLHDHAHDPINKNTSLKNDYHKRRGTSI